MARLVTLIVCFFYLGCTDIHATTTISSANRRPITLAKYVNENDDRVKEVLAALDRVPDPIWNELKKEDVKIEIVHVLWPANEVSEPQRPRGRYVPDKRQILVALDRRSLEKPSESMEAGEIISVPHHESEPMDAGEIISVLHHEIGHAYDYVMERPSKNPSIRLPLLTLEEAFKNDMKRLESEKKVKNFLSYYLLLGGKENAKIEFRPGELFAEAFAVALEDNAPATPKPNSSPDEKREWLQKRVAFKEWLVHVCEWVRVYMTQKGCWGVTSDPVIGKTETDSVTPPQPAHVIYSEHVDNNRLAACHAGIDAIAPKVTVSQEDSLLNVESSAQLTSSDTPSLWFAIPPAPLTVSVVFTSHISSNPAARDDLVQVLLDGEQLEHERYFVDRYEEQVVYGASEVFARVTYVFRLPCPAPGRHLIQARYLTHQMWSPLSAPVRFEVRIPRAPEIIAVSDSNCCATAPVPKSGLVSLKREFVHLKFANVHSGDKVIVYLDGREVACQELSDCGCCVILGHRGPPGIYAISARSVPFGLACSFASELSNAVMVRYDPYEGTAVSMKTACCGGAPCKQCAGTSPANQCEPRPASQICARGPCAFLCIPVPSRLSDCEPFAGCTPKRTGDAEPDGTKSEAEPATTDRAFLAAAHFPLRGFGGRGEVHDGEGLVIYEGMRFTTDNRGGYAINFLVGSVALPVTLRLQLLVQSGPSMSWTTITLPPITVRPERDTQRNAEPGVFRIHHCGYSPALERSQGRIWAIRREGTARLGYGFDAMRREFSY